MKTIDLGKLQVAHQMLSKVIDLLVEEHDFDGDMEWDPISDIDRTPPPSDQGVQTFVLDSVLSSIG